MMQELNYIRCGDYYIPDIRLPEENRPIGRWGRMHRDYIKEHMPIPILGDDIKQDVVAKVNESASLRRQSKQLLEYAKQAVEMAIEQGEDAALVWLKERSGE